MGNFTNESTTISTRRAHKDPKAKIPPWQETAA
jgi:hypothetical protein